MRGMFYKSIINEKEVCSKSRINEKEVCSTS